MWPNLTGPTLMFLNHIQNLQIVIHVKYFLENIDIENNFFNTKGNIFINTVSNFIFKFFHCCFILSIKSKISFPIISTPSIVK